MLKRDYKIGLVILTLNEIEGITLLWPKIPKKYFQEIFAIDAGSTDGTIEFYQKHKIPYIIQRKKGRGEAFRMAFRQTKCGYLLFFSPDGNEDPKDIPRLINEIQNGYEMIIASRFIKGGRNEQDGSFMPVRKWAVITLNRLANIFFNKSGNYIADVNNGFRIVSKKLFNQLKPKADGFEIEYELTIKAFKKNHRMKEIPTIEGQRIAGAPKAESFATGIRFLRLLIRELIFYKQ